ncbi:MAG: MBL fold metallo-hydrolase [Spirochaetes bacterium]|nr:MBL fold metallo-hydrolase [Spirochaetota bacterium]
MGIIRKPTAGMTVLALGAALLAAVIPTFGADGASAQGKGAAMLTFMGRASVKLTTASGLVIYIDPYAGDDYSAPADLVLVTHGHSDHNAVKKVKLKADGVIVAAPDAVPKGLSPKTLKRGETIRMKGVTVTATAAYNGNHGIDSTVGFLVSFDGIVVYHAGDTSKIPEMASLAGSGISYALFPVDGFYNMGPAEAAECALLVKAKRSIPIHSSANGLYDAANSQVFNPPGVIRMKPGESIPLEP